MTGSSLAASRLAVLSYHSWEIDPEVLINDIETLRRDGWQAVSLDHAFSFIEVKNKVEGKFFLVTSDDGSVQDEEFVEALRQVECPGVLFINIGCIPEERLPFYRQLAESCDIAIQDHGLYHRKHFISGCVYDYVTSGMYLGGLEHLHLQPGMPVCIAGSEVAVRRFIPTPTAMTLAAETVYSAPPGSDAPFLERLIEGALMKEGLGYRRLGRFYLRGKFETKEEFSNRVSDYLAIGQQVLREKLGQEPKYFAYPWWEGSQEADSILEKLGYEASFSGKGSLKQQDGRLFQIPRIPISSNTSRPISLEEYPIQYRRQGLFVAKGKRFIKTVLNVR